MTSMKRIRARGAMWVSAAVLACILTVQLVGFPERPAHAVPFPSMSDVATSGDYTMLNLKLSNEDLLVVLDSRNEAVFLYHIDNKKLFAPLTGGDVRALFNMGRQRGAGSK
jgi:hypothetical protein